MAKTSSKSDVKKVKVIKNFEGNFNDREFKLKRGDSIEVTPGEYDYLFKHGVI